MNLVYKTPVERTDGRAVVIKSGITPAVLVTPLAPVASVVPESKTLKKKVKVTGEKVKKNNNVNF